MQPETLANDIFGLAVGAGMMLLFAGVARWQASGAERWRSPGEPNAHRASLSMFVGASIAFLVVMQLRLVAAFVGWPGE